MSQNQNKRHNIQKATGNSCFELLTHTSNTKELSGNINHIYNKHNGIIRLVVNFFLSKNAP